MELLPRGMPLYYLGPDDSSPRTIRSKPVSARYVLRSLQDNTAIAWSLQVVQHTP